MPKGFITGVTGQDGSYLAELLLEKGYEVHGTIRPGSDPARSNIGHLTRDSKVFGRKLFLHPADLTDANAFRKLIPEIGPDELYHLAGQTQVGRSFDIPETTCEITGMASIRILEIARTMENPPRVFHASSSEIFGASKETPQNEETAIAPVNPYGCAKAFATQIGRVFRHRLGLFVSNGILYNHESPRRGESFVTRKICRAAAAIKLGREKELLIGDTSAKRDWGHARDYVRGFWLALQHSSPEDFVFSTGELHTVRDVVEISFRSMDLEWQKYVRTDPRFVRPPEAHLSCGDNSKAGRLLGWVPRISFAEMIVEMTRAEFEGLKGE